MVSYHSKSLLFVELLDVSLTQKEFNHLDADLLCSVYSIEWNLTGKFQILLQHWLVDLLDILNVCPKHVIFKYLLLPL